MNDDPGFLSDSNEVKTDRLSQDQNVTSARYYYARCSFDDWQGPHRSSNAEAYRDVKEHIAETGHSTAVMTGD